MSETSECPRCAGCGRVADSDSGEPWSCWETLPEASKTALRLGLVRPMTCPDCAGSGRIPQPGGPYMPILGPRGWGVAAASRVFPASALCASKEEAEKTARVWNARVAEGRKAEREDGAA